MLGQGNGGVTVVISNDFVVDGRVTGGVASGHLITESK